MVPDKRVLLRLFCSKDDTAYSPDLHRRIGNIAREGIESWTGMHLSNLPEPGAYLNEKGEEIVIKRMDKGEEFYQKKLDSFDWDQKTQKFVKAKQPGKKEKKGL